MRPLPCEGSALPAFVKRTTRRGPLTLPFLNVQDDERHSGFPGLTRFTMRPARTRPAPAKKAENNERSAVGSPNLAGLVEYDRRDLRGKELHQHCHRIGPERFAPVCLGGPRCASGAL